MRLIPLLLAPALLGAQAPTPVDTTIDGATKAAVVRDVLQRLDRRYVFPDKAALMATAINAHLAAGDYESISSATAFAMQLTRDLQAVSHDKHLRVRYGTPPGAPRPELRTVSNPSAPRTGAYGVGDVRILDGNVGYVELRSFGFPPEVVEDAIAEAMSKVADTDALIIDLRSNGGGSPGMVRLVSSYLFGSDTVHLNSLYDRINNRTEQFWTLPTVKGKRFGPTKPVYVLTSDRTFSAAEEFTYNLQSRKRATIVGETTGGGAHPGGWVALPARFSVFVPSGRAINPITGTNWEGVGIVPEVKVDEEKALETALSLAKARSVKP